MIDGPTPRHAARARRNPETATIGERIMRNAPAGLPLLVALVVAMAGPVPAAETVAFTGGKVLRVGGDPIDDGTIVIEDGRITAIGQEVEIPFEAMVVDVSGKVIFPGLVLAHTSGGLDFPNENVPVAPFLDVYDSLDPSSMFFEDALRAGMTALNVHQGNNAVVAGIGRAVRPIGLMVEEMTIRPDTGIKLSMGPKQGYDRMVHTALLREAFDELEDYLGRLAEKKYEEKLEEEDEEIDVLPEEAKERGRELIRDEDLDDKHRNLVRLLEGRLDALFYCNRAMDVLRAIEVAREQGFLERTTFVVGTEAFKATDAIAETGRPVVLPADLVHRERDPRTDEETETFIPKVFADAGIPFALSIDAGSSYGEQFLTYQAARCVRGGIDRETALRAITLVPAGIAGLEERLGSLEPGKDGDLLVLSGDPLDITTRVERVYVGGRQVYDVEKDRGMERILRGLRTEVGADDESAEDGAGAPEESAASPSENGSR